MEVGHSSASDDWPTPQWIVDQAAREFGPFSLDPASTRDNAKAPYHLVDGLREPWLANYQPSRVWLNPPYGRTIGAWMRKARHEVEDGRALIVVALVPVRVDAQWWQLNITHAYPKPLVRFWPRRIRYRNQDAPFASATVVYGRPQPWGRHGTVARQCPVCKDKPPRYGMFWPYNTDSIYCSPACKQKRWRSSLPPAPAVVLPLEVPSSNTTLGAGGNDPHCLTCSCFAPRQADNK